MNVKEKSISIPCNVKKVREIRSILMEFIEEDKFDEEVVFNLQLVMDEAVINAIDHGSANNQKMNVDIYMKLENDMLSIIVKDYGGKSFNPEFFERIAAKKTEGHGGRGIFLIKDFMDEVRYVFNPGISTLLFMGKKLTAKVPEAL
jgi:serine/threonine-protein kinase RsbW